MTRGSNTANASVQIFDEHVAHRRGVSEAYPGAAAGMSDIHVTNEIVGKDKLAMATELAAHVRLSVCVEDVSQLSALGVAATAAGVTISGDCAGTQLQTQYWAAPP
ncbi:hypothetical protein [Paraburkholderia mimosarum]|uniref:hypothetical protein n=2 Tax=Burkholderiaceae TaxID=119060 RepID=UPI000482B202|nr:hypothetical protein [Paraburkholderia mimosarum]